MAEKVIVSERFGLKWRDAFRALLLAVLSSVFPIIIESLNAGTFDFPWRSIAVTASSTAAAYILKNWIIEPPKVTTTYSSNEKAVNVGEDIKDGK